MRLSIIAAGTTLAICLASAAYAQTPGFTPTPMSTGPAPTVCMGDPVLPPQYAAMADRRPLATARTADQLPARALTVGQAVTASLAPTPEVQFVVQSDRPGGSVSRSGMFSVHIAETGTYYIALSGPPWIDVVKAGASTKLDSAGNTQGPHCSGIRKIVDFRMEAGDYVIQIAGAPAPEINILIGRRP
jgi:hypothetical protein